MFRQLREKPPEIHERLASATFKRLPYADVIRCNDAAETLFYFDPKQWDCETDFGAGFERGDFERLADRASSVWPRT